jgi:hypothetical protein
MRLLGPECDTFWKFPIPIEDDFVIEIPRGSIPLSVDLTADGPMVWAAVSSRTKQKERHRFHLRGTGHPLPNLMAYRFVGTFQIPRLGLVYHLFDGATEPAAEPAAEPGAGEGRRA